MPTIAPNAMGLNSTSLLQSRNTATRRDVAALEITSASGGKADYIADNTPDVKGMLGTNRDLLENAVHSNNSTKTNSRAQGQIQFIQLCQNIGLQLGSRLSDMRTDKGILDETFLSWCSEQLQNIASAGNSPMFDGTYPCASGTPTIAPIDTVAIMAPLPSGTGVTLDYAKGAFNTFDARLSSTATCSDNFNVTSGGTENLIRTLRICLTGNIAQAADPTWAFANDLLVNSAIPNIAKDFRVAGNLGNQTQETKDALNDLAPVIGKQFKDYAFELETAVIQKKFDEAAKASQQMSSLFTSFKKTQDFFDKMDQIS